MNALPELLSLLLIAVAVVVWQWLRREHEQAQSIAQAACKEAGLQWLDASVTLQSLRFTRQDGRRSWQLDYSFDVSGDGRERRIGRLRIHGGRLLWIEMPGDRDSGALWIKPD